MGRLIIIVGILAALFYGIAQPVGADVVGLKVDKPWSILSGADQIAVDGLSALIQLAQQGSGEPQAEPPSIDTTASMSLSHGCSLSADEIDAILKVAGSPAANTGQFWVDACQAEKIDDAYALSMFFVESGYGTAPGWAGIKPDGSLTHNTGNIICTDGYRCYGRFGDYADWKTGITMHHRLLRCYRDAGGDGCDGLWTGGQKLTDIRSAINRWAPAEDSNDPSSYANTVERMTAEWRSARKAQPIPTSESKKHPVTSSMVVNASFTSVDCGLWGNQPGCQHLGTDYAGADGDPVYASFDGRYLGTGAYAPGDPTCPRCLGQYVIYRLADGSELYFGHLKDAIQLQPGDPITAGTALGRIRGDLAHTHVQLRDPQGQLADFEQYYGGR